ncbi:unnamed protein product [Musa acuminata subsp. burmannicoides]
MEPIDLVPSGYRFLPTAEELLVDYLANWVAGAPPGRAVAFADVYGTEPWKSSRQRSAGGLFLCGAQAPRTAAAAARARRSKGERRQRFLTLYKSKKPLSPWSAGARWWSGERAAAFFQRWPAEELGWTMYEFEMCSSGGFETRVLCHVKRSSHCVPTPAAPPSKRLRPP